MNIFSNSSHSVIRCPIQSPLFTWVLWEHTMNRNLSMAMVITVREVMKAATLGMVRVSLEGATILYYMKESREHFFIHSF